MPTSVASRAATGAPDTRATAVRIARTTGVLYLLVAVLGAWAHLVVRGGVRVPDDPLATAANIAAAPETFRWAFVADLTQAALFVAVALGLSRLLRHVDTRLTSAMVVAVSIAAGMMSLNLASHAGALLVATDPTYARLLGDDAALVAGLLVELNHLGHLTAQVFFALWLLPLGVLVQRSRGLFPRSLGIVLVLACAAYLTEVLVIALHGTVGETLSLLITAPATAGEVWLLGYLLLRGVGVPAAGAVRGPLHD